MPDGGRHESNVESDGQGTYDNEATKDVGDAGGGRHASDDKG